MYTNNLEQIINFLYFIITGMILSIIFDIFRILRKSFKTSDIITNIEDIIFGIITGIIILSSVFLFNNGELRLYLFLGIAIGIIIYMLVISKYFIKFNVAVITLIKKIFILLTKPFIILFKFIKRLFFKPISFVCINIKLLLIKLFKNFKKSTKIHKKLSKKKDFDTFCRKI